MKTSRIFTHSSLTFFSRIWSSSSSLLLLSLKLSGMGHVCDWSNGVTVIVAVWSSTSASRYAS
jgi:hypothetical protein